MRRSNSRSVQSSGWASSAASNSCASPIAGKRSARAALRAGAKAGTILDLMSATGTPPTTATAAEHHALTHDCGLVDRSERGKLALTGAGAIEFLNGQVTNELAGLRAGEGRYAAFLTHKGKMLGDLRILALGDPGADSPAELFLDTERVALQALFDMVTRFKVGYDAELHKRTLQRGLLSLIGPQADRIAGTAALAPAEP